MERLEKVATPLTADTVVVPASVPPPGLVPIATVMLAVEPVTVFPNASCTVTCTAGEMLAPAISLLGCTVKASLEAAVSRVDRVLQDPAPAVQLADFAPDGLNLAVSFWIDDPHNGQGNVRSEVNLALLDTLNSLGVEIPYPQRVVRQQQPHAGQEPVGPPSAKTE